MITENLFQHEKLTAADLILKRTRGGAVAALVLGLLLMAMLPVSCRGDNRPERADIVLAVTNQQDKTMFEGKLETADFKGIESIETVTLEETVPEDSKPDARIVLSPVGEKPAAAGATATLTVHGPGLDDAGWSATIAWPLKSSMFLVVNKKYFVELIFKPKPETETTNNDGPAASAGDIEIFLETESGGRIPGAEVRLSLPGPDGSLDTMPNALFAIQDGSPGDTDGLKNGRVVLPEKYIKGAISGGQPFSVAAEITGFVLPQDISGSYDTTRVNSLKLTLVRVKKQGGSR